MTPTMLPLLPLILVSTLVRADQMPANWLGQYQLETSEGFTAFMSEIGVNWFTRQIACALYPTATNKDQRATKSSGVSRIETRNFKNNGQIMELVHTIPGKANIRSVRVYKKL